MQPTIIYEDNDIIVCHKPAGMATQTKRLGQQDMESFLKNYRAKKKEQPYVGIVHRLDQPVEGVMVFAKNQKAAADLSKQVQARLIGKHYCAICKSNCDDLAEEAGKLPKEATVTDYILTDKKNNVSRIVKEGTPQAKKAVLDYRVALQTEESVVFDITLHTGRQHQIRLQLSNMGWPIIGDRKYGTVENNQKGLQLCSYRIQFEHPQTKEKMDFKLTPSFLDNPNLLA